ncbi:hypothetical protein ACWER6_30315 [Streptomyces sp. NPDC004009]
MDKVKRSSLLVAIICAVLLLLIGVAELAHGRVRGVIPLGVGATIATAASMKYRRGTRL